MSHERKTRVLCSPECGQVWTPGFCDDDCPHAPTFVRCGTVLIERGEELLTRYPSNFHCEVFWLTLLSVGAIIAGLLWMAWA